MSSHQEKIRIAVLRARIILETPDYDSDEQRLAALWSITEPFRGYRAGIDVDGNPFVEILPP